MPTPEWLKKWKQVKEKTVSPVDLNTYFEESEIAGKQLAVMEIGPCSLPSGKILVRDPLVYLADRKEKPYFLTAPAGTYQTEVCVVKPDKSGDCARYAAVRLKFTGKRPVWFYEALIGHENLNDLEGGEYFGFNVDAGFGCICDEVLHQAICDWSEQWDREHPDAYQYYDYFAPLFAENYKAYPEFQREDGDFLNWQIPGTKYHLPIFQSGFGDGVYPVYWGMDGTGNISQIVIQFIDIELAYGEETAEE